MKDNGPRPQSSPWRERWRRCRGCISGVWACIRDPQCWWRIWAAVLDLAYVAWVLRVPVIALTANTMDGDRERCLAAGMNDFLAKPVSIAALRAAIDRYPSANPRPWATRV